MARQKKKSIPNSLIVTQSNKLVEARYNLPVGEQRLILTMISKVQPDDEDFKPYRISVSEFAEFMDIDKNHVYVECKKTTEKLLTRVVSVEEPDGLLQIGWLSSAKYVDGSGMVNLSFDPLLKPYLLQLKSNFTSSKLNMMVSFKSQYTMRIYTLLKQYERLKEREIELGQLREILGIRKDLHVEYRDFKRHVLEATKKELAEKADLSFEFDEIKYGRRVGAIRFHIFSKEPQESFHRTEQHSLAVENTQDLPFFPFIDADISPSVDKLVFLIPEQHRAKKTVLSAIIAFEKKAGIEYVKRNILYCNAKATKSYAGFFSNALKNDWGQDWQTEQQPAVKKKVPEVWERHGFKTQKEYTDFMFKQQMERYGQSSLNL